VVVVVQDSTDRVTSVCGPMMMLDESGSKSRSSLKVIAS